MEDEHDIWFLDDLTESYAASRKGMEKEDADDLMRCMLLYLRQKIGENKNYAYVFPRLGTIYKRIDSELQEKYHNVRHTLLDKMVSEYVGGKKNMISQKDRVEKIYGTKTKEHTQSIQNSL